MNWNELETSEQLKVALELSEKQPVMLFKHSTRCPISSMALKRMESGWDEAKAGDLQPYFLNLIMHREVSNEIEHRLGVRHESPQVLLIKSKKCVYNASHDAISFGKVIENI
ncbi:bacillithiol system redox-active protein YtxJ [Aureibacter tunicatorum]|uniref:Bacillithiol system protein YtxJ n=1 Tax=Aureibacter tunicatorum TaxID=866807 RepID=A0AAE3XLJ9_9BACT|nr:bacillithiol system redox-active protein YtxJ [Aureibacter tunicatorum]MDR6238006.1 bacillithiol system protein YtxJ [Aureibacter tunicatorum]BDD03039.1 thioredoxin family protein [Aureibacter tunicatorum]